MCFSFSISFLFLLSHLHRFQKILCTINFSQFWWLSISFISNFHTIMNASDYYSWFLVGFVCFCYEIIWNLCVAQVTFIEALDQLMPGFDTEISKLAQRVLINPRKIDYYTGVFATKVTFYFFCLHLTLVWF